MSSIWPFLPEAAQFCWMKDLIDRALAVPHFQISPPSCIVPAQMYLGDDWIVHNTVSQYLGRNKSQYSSFVGPSDLQEINCQQGWGPLAQPWLQDCSSCSHTENKSLWEPACGHSPRAQLTPGIVLCRLFLTQLYFFFHLISGYLMCFLILAIPLLIQNQVHTLSKQISALVIQILKQM